MSYCVERGRAGPLFLRIFWDGEQTECGKRASKAGSGSGPREGPYLNDILPFSFGLKRDMALLTEGKLELPHRTKVTLLYNIEGLRYA